MRSIFFYISGHGFGHSVRQIEIITALLAIAGDHWRVVVRTDAAPWLFNRALSDSVVLLPGQVDTGVAQIDSLRLDERATIELASTFYDGLASRITTEAALLAHYDARFVVADVPPLACAAADAARIASAVCGNFTWDWIYQTYIDASADASMLISRIQDLYRRAAAAWRLPLHGGFDIFRNVTDVPLVAWHGSPDFSRDEIRAALHLPLDVRLALVSFGGYGVRDLPLEHLDCTADWYVVLTTRDGDPQGLPRGVVTVTEQLMYSRGLRYQDIVRAVDVVISKPGYGIISDCVANGGALLYTSRGRFAEYDVLVREMPKLMRCEFIGMDDFLAGRWSKALAALDRVPAPAHQARTDGAEVVARLILENAPA